MITVFILQFIWWIVAFILIRIGFKIYINAVGDDGKHAASREEFQKNKKSRTITGVTLVIIGLLLIFYLAYS